MKLRCCRNFAPTRGGSAGGAAGGCLRSAAPADAGTRLTAMAAACGRRGAAPGSRGGADCARQVLVPGPSPGPWSPPLNLAAGPLIPTPSRLSGPGLRDPTPDLDSTARPRPRPRVLDPDPSPGSLNLSPDPLIPPSDP